MAKAFEELVLESLNNLHKKIEDVRAEVANGAVNSAVTGTKVETVQDNVDKLFDLVANGDESLIRQVAEIKTRVTTIENVQETKRKADESNDRMSKIVGKVVEKSKSKSNGNWKIYLGILVCVMTVIGGLFSFAAKGFELVRAMMSNGNP